MNDEWVHGCTDGWRHAFRFVRERGETPPSIHPSIRALLMSSYVLYVCVRYDESALISVSGANPSEPELSGIYSGNLRAMITEDRDPSLPALILP